MQTIDKKTPANVVDSRRVRVGGNFKLLPVADAGRIRIGGNFKLLAAR